MSNRTSPQCWSVTKKGKRCKRSENCPKHHVVNDPLKSARLAKVADWKKYQEYEQQKKFMKTNGGAQLPFDTETTIEYTYTWEDVKRWVNEGHIKSTGKPYYKES